MAITALNSAYSGMYANQFRQNVSANNVANVNTDGFRASAVQTTDAAYINDIGRGTRVAATYQPPVPGPMAPNTTGTGAVQATGAATTNAVQPTAGAGNARPATGYNAAQGFVEQSNTNIIQERTNQMAAQQAYGVNAAAFRTADQVTGTLLNMVR